MKRFLCLALTVAMVLSFATFSAFAADVTGVLSVTGDNGKVGDVLTASYTIKGADTVYAWQCIIKYAHDIIVPADSTNTAIKYKSNGEATAANAKKALISNVLEDTFTAAEYNGDYEDTKIWGQTGVKAAFDASNIGTYTVYASAAGSDADGNPAIVSADGYTTLSLRFVRIAEGDINIAYAEKTNAPVVEVTDASGNVIVNPTIDYTAPGGGDEPVDWTTTVTTDKPAGATSEDTKFEYRTDAKDPTQIGTGVPKKRVVVFAKNTTGAPLLAQTYGVTFGRSFYPGVADVPVDSYWSIILVDTDGTFLTQDSYSYTAKVGSVEAAAGNVTVQTAE